MSRRNGLLFIFTLSVFLFMFAVGDAFAVAKGKLAQNDDDTHSVEEMSEGSQPMEQSNTVSKDELNNFKHEMSDISKQVKDLQGQMKIPKKNKTSKRQLTVSKETEESIEGWKKTLNDTLKDVEKCVKDVASTASEDQRDIISDCRGNNFWDVLNDIREEFVPPQDLQNAVDESNRQLKELGKFKRKLVPATSGTRKLTSGTPDTSTSGTLVLIQKLNDQILAQQNAILEAKGRDQREMMNDFYSSNFHEEINKVRSMVELPGEMINVSKEMSSALKDASKNSMEKTYAFFGIKKEEVLGILNTKKSKIDEINDLMKADKYDEAMELAEEDIHQGWHPGDARHLLGMTREMYDRLKGVKDKDLKEATVGVVTPILAGFLKGDVRDARDTMVQFMDGMRKYEKYFRPTYNSGPKGLDKNMMKAIGKVQSLIEEKIEKGEVKKDMGDDNDDNMEDENN